MEEKILIENPKVFPYGVLSNDFSADVLIDKKIYPSATNYILSNLLSVNINQFMLQKTPVYSQKKNINIKDKITDAIKNREIKQRTVLTDEEKEKEKERVEKEVELQNKNIYDIFAYYYTEEFFQTINTALETAYGYLIESDPNMVNILLKTGNAKLEYHSDIGIKNNGIGKILTQIRNKIMKQYITYEQSKKIVYEKYKILNIYRANALLMKEIEDGNSILEYKNMNPEQIISTYLENREKRNPNFFNESQDLQLKKLGLGKEIEDYVLNSYKKGLLPLVSNEIKLSGYLFTNAYKHLENICEIKKLNVPLEQFTQFTISQKYPAMVNIQKASKQLYQTIDGSDTERVEKFKNIRLKVFNLYEKGLLPPDLTEKIKMEIEKIDRLLKDEVIEDQKFEFSSSSEEEEKDPLKKALSDKTNKNKDAMIKFLLNQKKPEEKQSWENIYQKRSVEEIKKQYDLLKEKLAVIKNIVKEKRHIPQAKLLQMKLEDLKALEQKSQGMEQKVKNYGEKLNGIFQKILKQNVDQEEKEEKEEKQEEKQQEKEPEIINITEENTDWLLFQYFYNRNTPFVIKGEPFYSVFEYVLTVLYGKFLALFNKITGGKTSDILRQSRKYFLDQNGKFYDRNTSERMYTEAIANGFEKIITKLAKDVMPKKFTDKSFLDILFLTGEQPLFYKTNAIFLNDIRIDPSEIYLNILLDIRKNQKANRKTIKIDKSNIESFINNNAFVTGWIEMRTRDMCNVIKSCHHYYRRNIQKKNLDSDFVENVLVNIYKSCLIDGNPKFNCKIPEKIVNIVREYKLVFPRKSEKELNEKLEKVKNQQEKYSDLFQGRYQEESDNDIFSKVKELEKLEKQYQAGIIDNSEEIMKKQEEIEKLREKKGGIEKQKETLRTKNELEIAKLKKQYEIEKKQIENSDNDANEKQRLIKLEFQEFYNRQAEINNKYREMELELEEKEKNQKKSTINKQDRQNYENTMKDYQKKINDILLEKRKNNANYEADIKTVANCLWKRICNLVSIILENVSEANEEKFQELIITSENIISKKLCCQMIFSDSDKNCIVSALRNLLCSILEIKNFYIENREIEHCDIDLACEIIINTSLISEYQKNSKKLENRNFKNKEENEEPQQIEEEQQELTEEEQQETKEEINYVQEQEELSNEDQDYYSEEEQQEEEQEEQQEEFEFRESKQSPPVAYGNDDFEYVLLEDLNKLNKAQEEIKNILLEVNNKPILDETLIDHFQQTIDVIFNATKPYWKIKQNRINFFANIF